MKPAARRGFGVALLVVTLVGAVLAAVLAGQAYFASGSTHLVLRLARVEQARALAESAIEEALVLLSGEANGQGGASAEAFRKFRERRLEPFRLDVPLARLKAFSQELAKHELYRKPPPVVTAQVRFQQPLDRGATPFHDQHFGTLELTATVSYQLDRATEQRTATRWYEFKTIHTTLPFPFDRTALFLHDAKAILNAHAKIVDDKPALANLLLQDAGVVVLRSAGDVQSKVEGLETEMESAQTLVNVNQGAAEAASKLQAAAAALRAAQGSADRARARFPVGLELLEEGLVGDTVPFLFGFPLTAFVLQDGTPAALDLKKYNLAARNIDLTREQRRTNAARAKASLDFGNALSDVHQLASDQPLAGAPDLVTAATDLARAIEENVESSSKILDVYSEFQNRFVLRGPQVEIDRFRGLLDQLGPRSWRNEPVGGAAGDPALTPGLAQFGIPKPRCQDAADLTKALGEILDRYGPPFQGTIHVDNAGGAPLRLDPAADRRFGDFEGRLTIACSGAAVVRDVKRRNPRQSLLTVVCHGPLTIGGRIEASLVAFNGLVRTGGAPATTIHGNLVLDQPSHELANEADVANVLENLTLLPDPIQLTTVDPDTVKPDRVSVLFAPAPIYSRAPREDPK